MRTLSEVTFHFSAPAKGDVVQAQKIMRIERDFLDLAKEVVDLVPEGSDRDLVLHKLLEAKYACVHTISRDTGTPKKEIKDGKNK